MPRSAFLPCGTARPRRAMSARMARPCRSLLQPLSPRASPHCCSFEKPASLSACPERALLRTSRRADKSRIMSDVQLSVVIPIRNEAPSLVQLHRELTDTLTRWGRAYELIIVDDGSTDESFETLAR